jgi:hypothetical protein
MRAAIPRVEKDAGSIRIAEREHEQAGTMLNEIPMTCTRTPTMCMCEVWEVVSEKGLALRPQRSALSSGFPSPVTLVAVSSSAIPLDGMLLLGNVQFHCTDVRRR